jgi:hypothetical protein
MTVLITRNRIFKINKTQKTKLAEDVKVVDGSGKFLIPGLWDIHIHPFFNEEDKEDVPWKEFMALFITNGIINVRVMFGSPVFHQWREEISSEKLIGPRMIIASPRPPGFSSVEEGRQFVRKSKNEGADFIKILSEDLPRDVYFAIADAKKQLAEYRASNAWLFDAVPFDQGYYLTDEQENIANQLFFSLRIEGYKREQKQKDFKTLLANLILKINFFNSPSESLIVSDKPVDKKQNLSITETLKTLKRLITSDVIILK